MVETGAIHLAVAPALIPGKFGLNPAEGAVYGDFATAEVMLAQETEEIVPHAPAVSN